MKMIFIAVLFDFTTTQEGENGAGELGEAA